MGFNIPNYTDAVGYGSGDMAEPDSVDFQALGNPVCAVIYDSNYATNGQVTRISTTQVSVAAYHVVINGTHYVNPTATTLTIAAGGASPRFDLVVVSPSGTTGTASIVTGTVSAVNPVYPALAANQVLLAALYVPSSGLGTGGVIDKRVTSTSNLTRISASAPGAGDGSQGDIWLNTGAVATGQSELYYKTTTGWENVAQYIPMSSANVASNLVLRDGSGGFSAGAITAGAVSATSLVLNNGNITGVGTITAASFSGPLTGAVTGNADTATKWVTARTISLTGNASGTSGAFDGTGNATINVTVNYATSAGNSSTVGGYSPSSSTTGNTIALRDASGVLNGERIAVGTGSGSYGWLRQGAASNTMYIGSAGGFDMIHVATSNVDFYSHVRPSTNNGYTLGDSSKKWSEVWATDGTINTSDIRKKNSVTDSILGLDFITKLRPVSYKWNESHVIFNKLTNESTSVPGVRSHYGFIAQEVKNILGDVDFAGWVLDDKDDPNSNQSLRYSEFIAPIVKAIQELAIRIEKLEAKK